MRLRKILSLALALCLLMTLLPLQTFAAAEKQTDKQAPLYANLKDSAHYPKITIQEVEPDTAEATEDSDALWEGTKTYAPTYLTVDNAAVKLRDYMKNRTTSFTLYVKYDGYNARTLVDELLEKATVHTGKPTEGDYLLWHLGEWGGQSTRLKAGSDTVYQLDVEMSYYTTAAQEKELTATVNALLSKLNVRYKSDYAKVKAVYDYICSNVTYDYANLSNPDYLLMYTAYAALVNKTAVCQGYATLLYRLLLELGVDCRVITGLAYTGEPHAWNIVKFGKVYYNMDATWDAELDPDQYFLRNSEMNLTHYRYLEYCSIDFHKDYPMSATDYVEGVAGVPEHVFASGVCGDNAYWSLDWDGLLIIRGAGGTYDYFNAADISQAQPWAYWREFIKKVIVEEGITALGNGLFHFETKPDNITSITLPESLVTIGSETFRECDSITEIRIPNGVKTIGSFAFAYCDNLRSITLGNSLEFIDADAFSTCKAVTEIQLPDSLKKIDRTAFDFCDGLTEVTIPASVEVAQGFRYCRGLQVVNISSKVIGQYAFEGCELLHTVNLSDGVTKLSSSAFSRCTSLRSITLPKSVKELDSSIFLWSTLNEIFFEGDAPAKKDNPFESITGTAYYPAGNETWTEEAMKLDFRSAITWVPYCPGHQWTEGSCDTPRTCIHCGESSGNDGHVYDDGVDGTCNICGIKREETEAREVVHMFRMYNPNTGEHFYTGSEEEKQNLIGHGWHYEGVGFTFPANTGDPVHRLFQPSTGEHLYTMDVAEKDRLMAEGWNYEGIAFNSAYDTEAVQHRLHNPNATVGAYHFTFSEEEKQTLIDAGWEYQGIGWYSCWK